MRRAALPLALYAAATAAAEPLAPALLRARARRGREDGARADERLGRTRRSRPDAPLVWLHAASVGESLSLLPLVAMLRERRPDLALLVTSGTVTSAEVLAERLPAEAIHQFVPVDGPRAVARFLDHWKPAAGLFVESELWPNLLLGAVRRGVRLALVSARLTEASARRWAKAPRSARALLGAFDLILAQDADSEERLARLGAEVAGRLNLKRLGQPPPVDEAELHRFRTKLRDRKVVLAASTHPGEEAMVVDAFRAAAGLDAVLVVAPRHPDRGESIAAATGAPRRSLAQDINGPIYVADTLGEMGLWLRLAEVVVMGGAFAPGIGGHNPLEAARLAKPILTGPHVANARAIYAELFDRAGAVEAGSASALARHLRGFLENPDIARRTGEAALACAAADAASFDEAFARLGPLFPP